MTPQTSDVRHQITIIGGGPVGSLLSIYLAQKKYTVDVYERRPDLRKIHPTEGRSINLALSHRGLRALNEVGLEEKIKSIAIPMNGRMIHDEKGNLNFQPYGEKGQFINSVSRNQLNEILIEKAEKEYKVNFHFDHICKNINLENSAVEFSTPQGTEKTNSEIIFGADGAFSAVRASLEKIKDFTFSKEPLSYGYKELHLPSDKIGKHLMGKNALHIWPREQFMLIALPNLDGSFTCTLFLPFKGANSFENITNESELLTFFRKNFPDALSLMPDIATDYFAHTASSLVTVHGYPWCYKDKVALIGDAAHAIFPFYGQGMNAGFEDCRVLNGIIEENYGQWFNIFKEYQGQRKINADAIAELSLQNFIEMRDLVGNEKFQTRKKIEKFIHAKHPEYLPLYSMVTFSDLSYAEALKKGKEHDQMMQEVMSIKNIESEWESEEGWMKIENIIKKYL